jgi:hypothetical protein
MPTTSTPTAHCARHDTVLTLRFDAPVVVDMHEEGEDEWDSDGDPVDDGARDDDLVVEDKGAQAEREHRAVHPAAGEEEEVAEALEGAQRGAVGGVVAHGVGPVAQDVAEADAQDDLHEDLALDHLREHAHRHGDRRRHQHREQCHWLDHVRVQRRHIVGWQISSGLSCTNG